MGHSGIGVSVLGAFGASGGFTSFGFSGGLTGGGGGGSCSKFILFAS